MDGRPYSNFHDFTIWESKTEHCKRKIFDNDSTMNQTETNKDILELVK